MTCTPPFPTPTPSATHCRSRRVEHRETARGAEPDATARVRRRRALFAVAARQPVLGREDFDRERRRSEEYTSELQSQFQLVCRLLLTEQICRPLPEKRQLPH